MDSRTGMLGNMLIREATGDDWSAIWPFLQRDIAAGETFCFDRDMTEDHARQAWFPQPPGRTVVAVDNQGRVVARLGEHENDYGDSVMRRDPMCSTRERWLRDHESAL